MGNYESIHKCIPFGVNGNGFSPHAMILPYLEQNALFNSINFDVTSGGFIGEGDPNFTAAWTIVSTFACPSDAGSTDRRYLGGQQRTNYAVNGGYGIQTFGSNGLFSDSGTANHQQIINFATIVDGLSHTSLASEWLLWSGRPDENDATRAVFDTPDLTQPKEFDLFTQMCQNLDPKSSYLVPVKFCYWIRGNYAQTILNHDLSPGGRSCLNGGSLQFGAYSAASGHPFGVNVLFADVHVKFFPENFDVQLWRALSTRSGNEPGSTDF